MCFSCAQGVNLQDRDKIAPYITEGIGTFLLVLTAALALGPFAPVSVGFMLMCQVRGCGPGVTGQCSRGLSTACYAHSTMFNV
jgi:hypothetical protein